MTDVPPPPNVWLCRYCGRSVSCMATSSFMPNINCGPHLDQHGKEFYVVMSQVGGVGFKGRSD